MAGSGSRAGAGAGGSTGDGGGATGAAFLEPSSSITTDASLMLDAVGGRATGTTTPSTPGMTGPSAAELKAKTRIAALGAVKVRVEALRCAAGSPAAKRLEAYIADVARLEALEAQSGGSTGGVTTPFAISPTLDPAEGRDLVSPLRQ